MRKSNFILVVLWFITPLTLMIFAKEKNDTIDGLFYSSSGRYLYFSNGKYLYCNKEIIKTLSSEDSVISLCIPDTLSFGEYKYDKNRMLLELTSDYNMEVNWEYFPVKQKIQSTVTERVYNSDSVYFYVESELTNSERINSPYEWTIKSTEFDLPFNYSSCSSKSLVIPKEVDWEFRSFFIEISPKPNKFYHYMKTMGVQSFVTNYYYRKNSDSNVFSIHLHEFDDLFFTSIRLNRDYVKLTNKKLLEWNGEKYKRLPNEYINRIKVGTGSICTFLL